MTVDALSNERTTVPAAGTDTVQVDPDALDEARKASGATYKDLADAVGVHKSMIGFLCTGRTITCKRSLGEAIEDTLEVERGSLFKAPDYQVLLERRGARANKSKSVAKPAEPEKPEMQVLAYEMKAAHPKLPIRTIADRLGCSPQWVRELIKREKEARRPVAKPVERTIEEQK